MRWLVVLGLLASAGCDDRPQQWDAFIYPDVAGSDRFETIAGFKTFELCRTAARDRIRQLPQAGLAAYECGYMCRYDSTMNINVCRETRD